tara:strand:- start:10889 stop:12049 length:1161 start_codon:yes stop_codon:yes gene_type:complete
MTDALQTVRKIAEIDNKKTGSLGNLKTQNLIKDYLSYFKGNIIQESYPITVYCNNKATIYGENLNICGYLYDYTGFNSNDEIKGEIIKVGKVWEIDFLLKNPKGKIIMCQSNLFIHRIMQIQKAVKKGAIAVIIVSNFDEEIVYGTGTSYLKEPVSIPAIGITKNQARDLKNGKLYSIKIDYKQKKTIGKNIIFEFEEKKSPTIVIGAHYDGWSYSAQDNTISLYLMFKIIESLKNSPSRHNYRFIFFDSEELGMIGSYNHLKKNTSNNYKIYINLEMIIPAKGSNLKMILYSNRTKHLIPFIKCLSNGYIPFPLDFFYKLQKKGFPSDCHFFSLNNIPAISTFSSSRFYHTKKDVFENINLKKIKNIHIVLNQILFNIKNDYRKN